jgi:hypothetical protein
MAFGLEIPAPNYPSTAHLDKKSPKSRGLAIHRDALRSDKIPAEPLAKLQWCDEFSTGMSGKRGVRGVLG